MIKNYIICFILIITLIIVVIFSKHNSVIESPSIVNTEIIKDSLIRDSIKVLNDSIVTKIKYIKIEHEKEVSTIMDNSDSANFKFFTEYIENYNNQRAIKNN